MAETEQRFVVHTVSRRFARFVVFPAGLFLVVAAIVIPADEPIEFIAALFGLPFLMWSWSVVWRRRVEVTEQPSSLRVDGYAQTWHMTTEPNCRRYVPVFWRLANL
jgi:hypothetical protein